MNSAIVIENSLEMDSLNVSHSRWENRYKADNRHGYRCTSFGFIVRGSVELHVGRRCMQLSEGTLFLVPEKLRYYSVWSGSPEIEYFSIHTHSRRFHVSIEDYRLQAIPEFSNEKTEALFRQIYSLYESGARQDKIRGLGLYCLFFADVLPYLEKSERTRMNPVLSEALFFIRENCCRNFSMADVADYCHISVSGLHHLFAAEMHTTPVQYRNELRIEQAAHKMISTKMTIEQIAEEAGFSSTIYFREVFKSITGMTPTAYRSEVLRTNLLKNNGASAAELPALL